MTQKLLVLSIISVAFLVYSARAAGPVLALEEEELDGYLKKKPFVMVDIYTPTCPHCKALAPEFLKAAKTAQADKKPYSFVKINGHDNPGINSRFQVSGYPTMKLFVNGNPISYEGNRSAEAILAFMDMKTGHQSTLLQTIGSVQEVLFGKGLRVCF